MNLPSLARAGPRLAEVLRSAEPAEMGRFPATVFSFLITRWPTSFFRSCLGVGLACVGAGEAASGTGDA
jgi:hypothetical protein